MCIISASCWSTVTHFAWQTHLTWVHQQIHPWTYFSRSDGSKCKKIKFSVDCSGTNHKRCSAHMRYNVALMNPCHTPKLGQNHHLKKVVVNRYFQASWAMPQTAHVMLVVYKTFALHAWTLALLLLAVWDIRKDTLTINNVSRACIQLNHHSIALSKRQATCAAAHLTDTTVITA